MKNALRVLLMVVAAGVVAGCDSGGSGDGGARVEPSDLPDNARSFLNRYFPGTEIRFAEQTGAGFDVYLENNVEVDFDASGNWTEVDGMGSALPSRVLGVVPSRAVNYARSNFNSDIVQIEREPYGFDLYLASGQTLEFGPSGNFLRVD